VRPLKGDLGPRSYTRNRSGFEPAARARQCSSSQRPLMDCSAAASEPEAPLWGSRSASFVSDLKPVPKYFKGMPPFQLHKMWESSTVSMIMSRNSRTQTGIAP